MACLTLATDGSSASQAGFVLLGVGVVLAVLGAAAGAGAAAAKDLFLCRECACVGGGGAAGAAGCFGSGEPPKPSTECPGLVWRIAQPLSRPTNRTPPMKCRIVAKTLLIETFCVKSRGIDS